MKKQVNRSMSDCIAKQCTEIPLSPTECFKEYLRAMAARLAYLADVLTDEPNMEHRLTDADKILMRQSVIPAIDVAQVLIKTGLMVGNSRMLEDGESIMARTKELLPTLD